MSEPRTCWVATAGAAWAECSKPLPILGHGGDSRGRAEVPFIVSFRSLVPPFVVEHPLLARP